MIRRPFPPAHDMKMLRFIFQHERMSRVVTNTVLERYDCDALPHFLWSRRHTGACKHPLASQLVQAPISAQSLPDLTANRGSRNASMSCVSADAMHRAAGAAAVASSSHPFLHVAYATLHVTDPLRRLTGSQLQPIGNGSKQYEDQPFLILHPPLDLYF
jgi:hypothetical protein